MSPRFRTLLIWTAVPNMLVLVGVVALHWRLLDVFMIFWAESILVGLVAALAVADGRPGVDRAGPVVRALAALGLVAVVALYAFGALAVVTAGLGGMSVGRPRWEDRFAEMLGELLDPAILVAIAAFAAGEVRWFVSRSLRLPPDRRPAARDRGWYALGRLAVILVSIVVGVGLFNLVRAPFLAMVILLVALKTALDVAVRSRSNTDRERAAARGSTAGTG